eukprot:scaffold922_cov327-Pinguiococcus_pyrenoidosus.AAC.30
MSSRPPESGVLRSRRQRLLQSIIRPVGHKSKGLMGLNKFLHNESLTTTRKAYALHLGARTLQTPSGCSHDPCARSPSGYTPCSGRSHLDRDHQPRGAIPQIRNRRL